MGRAENVILTNMCMIFDHKGNVVVQDRTDSSFPGIVFPGGHVEKGESITDSVIREVWEETGLTVSNLQMCGVKDIMRDDGTRYIVFLYKTDHFEGMLSSSNEGEVWWAPLSELPDMKLAETMETMLEVFCNDTFTEIFYCNENGKGIVMLK